MKHEFNTPDTPQTGTTMVERSWGPLSEKARVLLIESGLKKKYYFYAMEYAADCMNLLGGSESNKMEPGQAPDATLGTPDALKALVDAAHGLGLMVFLDVVYNHFGPDGAYLHAYAKRFFDEGNYLTKLLAAPLLLTGRTRRIAEPLAPSAEQKPLQPP
jgi:hypothetical protein